MFLWRHCPRWSYCHRYLLDGLALWISLPLLCPGTYFHCSSPMFSSCLFPICDAIDFSCLPDTLYPLGLKMAFVVPAHFKTLLGFMSLFTVFPLSLFPRAASIAFCSSYMLYFLYAISSADTSQLLSMYYILVIMMTSKSNSASLIVHVIFPPLPFSWIMSFQGVTSFKKVCEKERFFFQKMSASLYFQKSLFGYSGTSFQCSFTVFLHVIFKEKEKRGKKRSKNLLFWNPAVSSFQHL